MSFLVPAEVCAQPEDLGISANPVASTQRCSEGAGSVCLFRGKVTAASAGLLYPTLARHADTQVAQRDPCSWRRSWGPWGDEERAPQPSTEPGPRQPYSTETPSHRLQNPGCHVGDTGSWPGPQPHLHLCSPHPVSQPRAAPWAPPLVGPVQTAPGCGPCTLLSAPSRSVPPSHPPSSKPLPSGVPPAHGPAPTSRNQAATFVPVGLCSVRSQSEGTIPEGSLHGQMRTASVDPQWRQGSPS